MKCILLVLALPLYCLAQSNQGYKPDNEKLFLKAKIVTDSGIIKGYFVSAEDSTVILSSTKRYADRNILNIPVNTINTLQVRDNTGNTILAPVCGAAIGFILGVGLSQENKDINDDGETSLLEFILGVIKGISSGNKAQRKKALVAGGAGGTLFLIVGMLTDKKISFAFPGTNRVHFYRERQSAINNFRSF